MHIISLKLIGSLSKMDIKSSQIKKKEYNYIYLWKVISKVQGKHDHPLLSKKCKLISGIPMISSMSSIPSHMSSEKKY